MAKLSILENNYPMSYREAFENVATHIFCVMLDLQEGINRPIGKKGTESYPVHIGTKLCAYQAKYYDTATKLKDKKAEFISSVNKAREKGITDLYFFVNKDHTENSRTGGKPSYLTEIESTAQGSKNAFAVTLHWWTLSKIEQTLDMPKYQYIRDLYLGKGTGSKGVYSFYEYIYNECIDNPESDLYGGMSLLDSYIEPTLELNNSPKEDYKSVTKYLEQWVEGKAPISVICGEPGHGKTSLCYKAMCDYYKNRWLAGKVLNVFCFSLNPANTDAIAHDYLNIYDLLSWGDDRKNQKINKEACREALIFFDGFDELKEWYPGIDLGALVKNHILPFQKNTNAHIVITSRTMAVDPEKNAYTLRNGMYIPINKLQPISTEKQYKWIENYIQHVQYSSPKEADEIERYYKDYRELFDDLHIDSASLKDLLGIPIIFRMTVIARYLPKTGQGVMGIYNDLFDITWERHKRQDDKNPLTVKEKLAEHALKIFIDDNLTAETDMSGNEPWLFSFYTTHEGRRRVGFLHRSFYQYFLAYEILSWYEKYVCDNKIDKFRNSLSYLSERRLDRTTLVFIKELYQQVENKEAIGTSINESYKILKTTDGILPLPNNGSDSRKIDLLSPLVRANNAFWNIISIGSTCYTPVSAESVNEISLGIYELSDSILANAKLRKTNLNGARLRKSDLSEADLSESDLSEANLSGADLSGANLHGAKLRGVYTYEANLSGADLSGAEILGADFSGVNLNGADLSGANLSGANLCSSKLNSADLSGADLSSANLNRANLSDADLSGADLSGADLSGADLSSANLSGAYLSCAFLFGTDLHGANLNGANLRDASLRGADFRESNLILANFSNANLCGADLSGANLNGAKLSGSDLRRATLSDANLYNVELHCADIRWTRLQNTKMLEANVKEARITEKEYDYIRQQEVKNINTIIIDSENE